MENNIFDTTKNKLKEMPLVDLLAIDGDSITERFINEVLIERHREYDLSLQDAIKSNHGQIIYYTLCRIAKNLADGDTWDQNAIRMAKNAAIYDLITHLNRQIGINHKIITLKREKGILSRLLSKVIKIFR